MKIYKTLDELLKEDVVFMCEYEGFYYVRLATEDEYDQSLWKVDKKTKKASFCDLMPIVFDLVDNGTFMIDNRFRN